MKNKEKLIAQINETEKALADMKQGLEECEVKEWWPEYQEMYYSINKYGWPDLIASYHSKQAFQGVDRTLLGPFPAQGNIDNLKRFAKKLHALCRLKKIADQLNDGWVPDWSYQMEEKYSLNIESSTGTLYVVSAGLFREGLPVFKTRELAEKALEWMGDEAEDLFVD